MPAERWHFQCGEHRSPGPGAHPCRWDHHDLWQVQDCGGLPQGDRSDNVYSPLCLSVSLLLSLPFSVLPPPPTPPFPPFLASLHPTPLPFFLSICFPPPLPTSLTETFTVSRALYAWLCCLCLCLSVCLSVSLSQFVSVSVSLSLSASLSPSLSLSHSVSPSLCLSCVCFAVVEIGIVRTPPSHHFCVSECRQEEEVSSDLCWSRAPLFSKLSFSLVIRRRIEHISRCNKANQGNVVIVYRQGIHGGENNKYCRLWHSKRTIPPSPYTHKGGHSAGWTFIRVVSYEGSVPSGWSLNRMVFHQGGLLWG